MGVVMVRSREALWQESGAESVQVRLHDSSRDVVNDFFDICELGKAPIAVPDDLRLNRSITRFKPPCPHHELR